jgi:hypothetical protein
LAYQSLKIAAFVIGTAMLATPLTAAAEPPSHAAQQNQSAGATSKAPTTRVGSGELSGQGARFVLMLVPGGGIGPITSSVIAGGGGTSAAGSFSITGTIGQSTAGPAMTGSNFSVTSGFWSAGPSGTTVKKRRGQITSQD